MTVDDSGNYKMIIGLHFGLPLAAEVAFEGGNLAVCDAQVFLDLVLGCDQRSAQNDCVKVRHGSATAIDAVTPGGSQ